MTRKERFIIANLGTGIAYADGYIFDSQEEAEQVRDKAILAYAITTNYKVCKVVPLKTAESKTRSVRGRADGRGSDDKA